MASRRTCRGVQASRRATSARVRSGAGRSLTIRVLQTPSAPRNGYEAVLSATATWFFALWPRTRCTQRTALEGDVIIAGRGLAPLSLLGGPKLDRDVLLALMLPALHRVGPRVHPEVSAADRAAPPQVRSSLPSRRRSFLNSAPLMFFCGSAIRRLLLGACDARQQGGRDTSRSPLGAARGFSPRRR